MKDDLDPFIIAAFNAQPPDVKRIAALRAAMKSVFSTIPPEEEAMVRQRTALVQRDPDVRAAMLTQFAGMVDQIAELLAPRVGRSATDFPVRNLAGALIGVLMSSVLAATSDPEADLTTLADAAMAAATTTILNDEEIQKSAITTIDIFARFIRPVNAKKIERLRAEAKVVRAGGRLVWAEADVLADGELVGKFASTGIRVGFDPEAYIAARGSSDE